MSNSVALYARGTDAAAELHRLRHVAQQQRWRTIGEFAEVTPIGSRRARPEYRDMLERVRTGALAGGVILTPSLSVLFDSLAQLVSELDRLRVHSVRVVTLAKPAELDEDHRLSVAALARFQQDLRRKRIQRGLDEARRNGKPVGRARVIVPLERARALISEGKGLRETARIIGVAPSTLHRKLRELT